MNEANNSKSKSSEIENLIDGKIITVTYNAKKAKESGAKGEEIRVRKIPIFDMEPLGRTFGKFVGEVALYAERDEAWARSLDEESFGAVLEEGRKLNFTSFKKWWAWQEQTLDGLGQKEDQDKLISRVIEQLNKPAAPALPSASANASSS